jgi:hypothetical protein
MNDDRDDEELRHVLGGDFLADGGFTERVMACLPPPRRRAPRGWVLGASSALALAVLWVTPAAPWFGSMVARFARSGSLPLSAVVVGLALMGATLGATAYAARPS